MEEDASTNKIKKVKSKSFVQEQTSVDKSKANKSFDFASLHKQARKERATGDTPKRAHKKHKEKLLDGSDNNEAAATSTPKQNTEKNKSLKSIMKNTSMVDESLESYTPDYYASKRKKRNKSVSFVLEDESASKKSKPDDSSENLKTNKKTIISPVREKIRKKERKHKKIDNGEIEQSEKENVNESNKSVSNGTSRDINNDNEPITPDSTVDDANNNTEKPRKKKFKKNKKAKQDEKEKPETDANKETAKASKSTTETTDTVKKSKKHKREAKRSNSLDNDEPLTKTRKQGTKAENKTEATTIAEDLENLNIGDNPHTLTKVTDLLDEMTVAGKNKKKKNKSGKIKKGKSGKDNKQNKNSVSSTDTTKSSVSSTETTKNTVNSVSTKDVVETLDLENIEEGTEKIKWTKRKWNKDKKVETNDTNLLTFVIVENLPLKIMLNYKKVLNQHFSSCGAILGIGIVEVYPTEEPKPVFTTTVHFADESAATKALEEDNTSFAGSRIRVKRPLPPTATTIVVRSYGEMSEQALSSAFNGAGRIRAIRLASKGKKGIPTAFVEFNGPQSVERALKMAEDARIGGKKIHVSKFEVRQTKKTRESSKEKYTKVDCDVDNE